MYSFGKAIGAIFGSATFASIAFAQSSAPPPPQTPPTKTLSEPACTEKPEADALVSLCVPPSRLYLAEAAPVDAAPTATIALRIASGTPLRIAVTDRVRITHVGALVRGTVVQPVYAFDQIVIPAGSVTTGRITNIRAPSAGKRAMSYANGDFSPFRKYDITFDTLTLPDGKSISIRTTVSPGVSEVVHLVSHPNRDEQKSVAARAAENAKQNAKGKIQESKDEMRQSWNTLTAPGKLHRLKQLLASQLPYRREYIETGTRFVADLSGDLDFGSGTRTGEQLAAIGSVPPNDTILNARLVTELSSATAKRGTPVTAMLTQPLYSPTHQLILPVNSLLVGEVVQAKPARKLHHNGDLRVRFERIETPEVYPQQISRAHLQEHQTTQSLIGNLEGVEVDRSAHMKLDEEGGAHAADSKTRYLSTGLALMIAVAAAHPDAEHGTVDQSGDPSVRTVSGGSGFRLVGAVVSFAAKSNPVSAALGIYGASTSVYANFLSRGREVVLPKDTPLEIGFGAPHPELVNSKNKPQ